MSVTAWNKMIYIYSGDRLHKTDSLRQALKLEKEELRGQRPVVSAVGAGARQRHCTGLPTSMSGLVYRCS